MKIYNLFFLPNAYTAYNRRKKNSKHQANILFGSGNSLLGRKFNCCFSSLKFVHTFTICVNFTNKNRFFSRLFAESFCFPLKNSRILKVKCNRSYSGIEFLKKIVELRERKKTPKNIKCVFYSVLYNFKATQ